MSLTILPSLLSPKASLLHFHLPQLHSLLPNQDPYQLTLKLRKTRLICRADFAQDAPFAVAIGASVLNSLVFPVGNSKQGEDGESPIDSTDARFAVMGVISFIPYFNWLSWVFAWLDTSQRRYVVYSLVYLAPYLRTNLSLSPEESWLPIASIVMCIIHIQLEASIQNGDLQGFQLFNKVLKLPKGAAKGHQELPKKERTKLAEKQSRNELRGWGVPEKPLDHQLEEDEEADGRGKR